jgi:hypothetical protein
MVMWPLSWSLRATCGRANIKNMRHDRLAIISGANPIPAGSIRIADRRIGAAADVEDHAACGRGQATPRAGTFARAG